MNSKYISVILGVVLIALLVVGCASGSGFALHRIKVIDASTKQPITGANVTMLWPGVIQESPTDGQGVASFGGPHAILGARAQEIDVTKQGYEPLSFHLTNGIPRQVEITPIQNPK